jgi:acetylornithine/N-succinyldiaminopimelate aminotransferase
MQEEWIEKAENYIAHTYKRIPIVLTKGEGCWLWDMNGRRYLDFLSGIAVCNLGHAHKNVVDALAHQAARLFHTSNLFYTEPQIRLAEMLIAHSFGDGVFFCNSGAESNEAAIKLARRYSWKKYGEGRHEIIALENSFHGRTMATLSATGQPKFHTGFAPLLEGFTFVPLNDFSAIEKAVSDKTCAVMLELIQSEGGVFVAEKEYLKKLREFTKKRDILLVLDEVQTGMGRTGRLFGYEHFDITPDIMSLAKALGNGFPMGAIVGTRDVLEAFEPGTHASTFGGNPLAASAAVATLNTLIDDGIIQNCEKIGKYLYERLLVLKKKNPLIVDVRGMGLLLGIEVARDGEKLVKEFLDEGVILYGSKENVIRLLPPLIIGKEEIEIFLDLAERLFQRHV